MRRTLLPSLVVVWLILLSSLAQAQTLDNVLKKMDAGAANFHTAEANFVWEQYQRVVNETDTQKGTVYYRKT
ncbi:MAG: outer membrane lipoprotein-sorting protein, partial [Candidatus Sulfotelmatobacter sp.]